MSGTQQVGRAAFGTYGPHQACLWSGTPESFLSLHPIGWCGPDSAAWATTGTHQIGWAGDSDWSPDSCDVGLIWNGAPWDHVNLNPQGADFSRAYDMTETHQVGMASFDLDYHAVLWSGTAASYVDLHPTGSANSWAMGVAGAQQVGYARFAGHDHACLWHGTAESFVDLHPVGAAESDARDTTGDHQVGWAEVAGLDRASLWSGSPQTWMDLHALLGPDYTWSWAVDITESNGMLYVAGRAYNGPAGRDEAILWTGPVPEPCVTDINGDWTVNVLDILLVLAEWGNAGGGADVNFDGIVNVLDLLEVIAAWGPC